MSKCKVLYIPGKLKQATPDIKLNGQTLEVVSSYKYLVKQLKRSGFKENILVNM
jgi:hypothetical protein